MFTKGQIVYSKSGRDKQRPFIIVNFDTEYVYIVDGSLRKLDKPKKKKIKHIQIVNKIDYDIKRKLEENLYLLDSDFRKSLEYFKM